MQDEKSAQLITGRPAPSTDASVWLSGAVLALSLFWSLFVLSFVLASDPYTATRDQCVHAFFGFAIWFYPQLLATVPSVAALAILIRYALRGNRRLPGIGLWVFAANVVASTVLLWYMSTLPSYFR